MTAGYPLLLRLDGRRVLVAGAGTVAARRIPALLEAGARVVVVAPEAAGPVAGLAAAGRLAWERRGVEATDVDGSWLVHACTDDPAVNAQVGDWAEAAGILCVRADDATAGSAHTPAVARSGEVTVAVSADGDPRRAVAVRDAVRLLLHTGGLPLLRTRPHPGRVALVGGGPGDPELITVRGRRLLAEADVVVVDKLAPRALLDELSPGVEVVEAGKAPHRHNLTQDQINDLLVDRARAGALVVRLKGGDPFVFGRGGEEALACVRAGIPFEVVPGVTSAVAVPAYAGIPVTHRGLTQDFAVVSGHVDPSHPGSTVDWEALATGPGTLVLLMVMERLELVAQELVKRGRDELTPVAVIRAGTTPDEEVVVSDLAHVAVDAAHLGAPAVVVVGDVVRLRESLAWR